MRRFINNKQMRKKQYVSDVPELLEQWDYDKNTEIGLKPEEVSTGCRTDVFWKCKKCGGTYPMKAYNKKYGRGCPYCAGKKALIGFNDLETIAPDLAKQWHPTLNGELTPKMVTKGYRNNVYWLCDKGHVWDARIAERLRGDNCPYCSGRRVLAGFNDLATTHPELAAEWDYEKNGNTRPSDISAGMNKEKFWWICPTCGNSYPAYPLSRSGKGKEGCPICGKEKQKKSRIRTMLRNGENSLEVARPDLAKEWHPTLNGDKKPSDYTRSSNEKIYWLCSKCGNVWRRSINARDGGRGCPECNERSTSFSEQAVFFYIKKVFPDAISRDNSKGFELDISIPSINCAIEYDGCYFHGKEKSGMSDSKKEELCADKGMSLIRIREKGLSKTKRAINIFRNGESNKDLEMCIVDLYKNLGVTKYEIPNIKKDIAEINDLYTESFKKNSFQTLYPEAARLWHPTKNGNLLPSQVTAHSGRYAYFLCEKGHTYFQAISGAAAGHRCNKCSYELRAKNAQKRGLIIGKNDLATLFPEIADEWDYERNEDLPDEYLPGSNAKKYWICKTCGHKWKTAINNRTSGKGCKKCSSKK